MKSATSTALTGRGTLFDGARKIAGVYYTIQISAGGQASIVVFDRKLPVTNRDLLYLTLEDGRVLQCHVLEGSPYCAVVRKGQMVERRHRHRSQQ